MEELFNVPTEQNNPMSTNTQTSDEHVERQKFPGGHERKSQPNQNRQEWTAARISVITFLYNIYTSDLPETDSRKFIYADDIAIAFQAKSFEEIEEQLEADLRKMTEFFKN